MEKKTDGTNTTASQDFVIQWHPAFCAATELEFSADSRHLDFQREYNLSKKPLQIDLLIVKKQGDAPIENEIGHIFRQHNIIEFKSPGDGLSIDDFFKTAGYACIYKSLGKSVDQIPADQITMSLFREGEPLELFKSLEKYKFAIEKKYDGIYYVKNFFIPAQIVVTRKLCREKHMSLKVLSKNALEEDILGFVENAQNLTSQGDRANVDAVMQASVMANYELFDKMKRRNPIMCEAMRMLMKDEIADDVIKAQKYGEMKGHREGILETLFGLVRDNVLSITDAAERANMDVPDFEAAYKTFCP